MVPIIFKFYTVAKLSLGNILDVLWKCNNLILILGVIRQQNLRFHLHKNCFPELFIQFINKKIIFSTRSILQMCNTISEILFVILRVKQWFKRRLSMQNNHLYRFPKKLNHLLEYKWRCSLDAFTIFGNFIFILRVKNIMKYDFFSLKNCLTKFLS